MEAFNCFYGDTIEIHATVANSALDMNALIF